jgi:hypothetical protein
MAATALSLCHCQQTFHHHSRSVARSRAISEWAAILSLVHNYVHSTRTVDVVTPWMENSKLLRSGRVRVQSAYTLISISVPLVYL